MKKFFGLLLVAGAGYVLWRKYVEADGQRDLWSEVTDPVD